MKWRNLSYFLLLIIDLCCYDAFRNYYIRRIIASTRRLERRAVSSDYSPPISSNTPSTRQWKDKQTKVTDSLIKFERRLNYLEKMNPQRTLIEDYVSTLKNVAALHPFRDAQPLKNASEIILPHILRFLPTILQLKHHSELMSYVLWSCGRMEMQYDQYTALCTDLFLTFLHQSDHTMESVTRGVYGASRMGFKLTSGNPVWPLLRDALTEIAPAMDARGLANSIYSLSTMNITAELAQEAMPDLLDLLSCLLPKMEAQGVANTIYGLGFMKFSYRDFPNDLQEQIEIVLERQLPLMTSQGLANILFGLGAMQANFRNFGSGVRHQLIFCVIKEISNMSIVGLSGTLRGLATLQVEWDDLPFEAQDLLQKSIQQARWNKEMTPRGLSNICYSLGKMGALWCKLSRGCQEHLLQAFHYHCLSLSPQGLSNTLYGFSLMQLPYNLTYESCLLEEEEEEELVKLPLSFSLGWEKIQQAMQSKVVQMSSQELANAIYALGLMGCQWKDLDSTTTSTLLIALNTTVSLMKPEELSITLYSLSKMQVSWFNDLPPSLQDHLQVVLLNCLHQMNEQAIANTLYGLAIMGLKYTNLLPSLHGSITKSLNSMQKLSPHGMTNILYSLALLGVYWQNINIYNTDCMQKVIYRIMSRMNEKGIAHTLYSLALMDASWTTLTFPMKLALCSALNQTAPSMFIQEVANTMYALTILSFDSDYSISYHLLSKEAEKSHNSTLNNLSYSERLDFQERFESSMLLYYAHSRVLQAFKRAKVTYNVTVEEEIDQLMLTNTVKMKGSSRGGGNNNMDEMIGQEIDEQIGHGIRNMTLYGDSSISTEQLHLNQFAIYFAAMNSNENTRRLVVEVLGEMPNIVAHSDLTFSRVQRVFHEELDQQLADLSRRQHRHSTKSSKTNRSKEMINAKHEEHVNSNSNSNSNSSSCSHRSGYSDFIVQSEFPGLQGIFPMDIAVFLSPDAIQKRLPAPSERNSSSTSSLDLPLAFIEVDGLSHYIQTNSYHTHLKRTDRLKEYLYNKTYPGVPIYRIDVALVNRHNFEDITRELAKNIVKRSETIKLDRC